MAKSSSRPRARGRGRPKQEERRRDLQIKSGVTPREQEQVYRWAYRNGIEPSEAIRSTVLAAAEADGVKALPLDDHTEARIAESMRKMGYSR